MLERLRHFSTRAWIMIGVVVALVAGGVVAAVVATSGSGKNVAAPTTPPTTLSPSASGAPTSAARPVFPLTGLTAPSAAAARRPTLAVKIDNVDDARPQAGINAADLVVEEVVEGGLTRLFAVFQSQGAGTVGPIRSARPADAELLRAVGGGIFAFSGADPRELRPIIDHGGAVLLSNDHIPQWFYRSSSKPAPHNVFSSTARLYTGGFAVAKATHKKLSAARSFFPIGRAPVPPRRARHVATSASGFASAAWAYHGGRYWRSQNGTEDRLSDGKQIWADNIVVMQVRLAHTGIFDAAHNEDPLDVLLGTGRAWAISHGHVAAGTWRRHDDAAQTTLRTRAGRPILIPPGRTWIELVPVGRAPSFS